MNHLIEPGMMPATGVHLIGGAPFAGKSTIVAQIIKSHHSGQSFLDGLTFKQLALDQIGIIFTDRPMTDNDIWLRQEALLDIQTYCLSDDPSMAREMEDLAKHRNYGYELFRLCFDKLPEPDRIRSLFLDVGTNLFFGHSVQDAAGVHRHMMLLQQFSKLHNMAITSLCYGTKQKKGKAEQYARAVDRIIGAPTLRGGASTMIFLTGLGEDAESTEAGYQPLHWFTRHGESRVFNVKKDARGLFIQVEGVVTAGPPTRRNWDVCDYVAEPMTKAQIVKAAMADGHSQSTVYEAIKFAVTVNQLVALSDGRFCLAANAGNES